MKFDDFVVVIVSYFSYGWTQQCLGSLWKYFPECKVLAVDNNPSESDTIERKKTFENLKTLWPYDSKKKIELKWSKFCELEKKWLSDQPNITTIQTPIRLNHGAAINFAIKWCVQKNIEKIVLLEPDCCVKGKSWLCKLLSALEEGYWMASAQNMHGTLHPCPSAWAVKHASKISFDNIPKTKEDLNKIFFNEYFKKQTMEQKLQFLEKEQLWDTGIKAWHEFAKVGRAKYVKIDDFHHYWNKSWRSDHRIPMI